MSVYTTAYPATYTAAASVAGSWQGAYALPSGYAAPPPAASSLAVPVANTGLGGNWLFALCAWRTPPGVLTTVAVGDDAHNAAPGCNVWEPLGSPNGTTPLSGNVACSVWYCRSAFPAQNVLVSPDGPVTAMAVQVVEMSGLGPWATLATLATGYAASATSGPPLSPTAPPGTALVFTMLAGDNYAPVLTGPGAAWTYINSFFATNGLDHLADCTLSCSYQVTTLAPSASWTSSAPQDLAAVTAGVLITGNAPAAPSQAWPYVQMLAGFGAGAQTPWDQVPWTDVTPRFKGASSQRGKQYELDSIQAGTVGLTLSNNDGALTMGNAASPYWPGVQVYTPARLLATWPPPPAQNARTYSVWRGYVERWPQALSAARYQSTAATGTDVYALLTPLMRTIAQAEILADAPYAYWPCNDPAGSVSAANLAKGNSQALQVVQSKYGSGGATATFGTSVGFLQGDPSCTGWQQAAVPAGGTQGWCLYYQDPNLPSASGGVTIEGWFTLAAAQPAGLNLTLISVRNSQGNVIQARVSSAGQLTVDVWDKLTHAITSTTVITQSLLTGVPVHVALTFTQATWTLYADGGGLRSAAGSCNLANTGWWLQSAGWADRLGSSNFANVIVNGLAVYGYQLPQSRVISHFRGALDGLSGQDTSGPRIDRLLGDGNCAYPRIMPPGPNLLTGALDVGGQAVSQNVVNVAESDSSWLMTDSAGYLFLQARRSGYDLPALWTFGELQAAPLNANSQFIGTVSPWRALNGAAVSYSAAWSYESQGSMLITPNGTTASPAAIAEKDPVTPGTSYTASAWAFSAAGWSAGVFATIVWYNSGGSQIAQSPGTALPVTAGAPLQVSVTARAPAAAAFAAIAVTISGTPPASTTVNVGYAPLLPPTEYAYLQDIATDCDPSQTYNDVAIAQLSAPPVLATTLTAAAGSGATTLAVASATGIIAGSVLLLAAGTGAGELVTVTAVTGLTVTITPTGSAHGSGAAVTVLSPAATGVTITASSPASIAAYGDQTLQQTSYLSDPGAIGDQAQWIIQTAGSPVNRIATLTLDPAANPALWPVVLGLETGQVVQVNRRLQGTQPEISGQFQVMSVAHQTAPGQWRTRCGMVPYPGSVLVLDDPARGAPGANCIGW